MSARDRQQDFSPEEPREPTAEELLVTQGASKVEEHGEYGPLLVNRDQSFLTAREAARRRRDGGASS